MDESGVNLDTEAKTFLEKRGDNKLSTDQLMNAIFVLEQCRFDTDAKKQQLLDILYRPLS
jgi:capsule polysaccharide export protein KpsE/RkpR